jgi:regulator of protease activity HflC (stomatin/prohibitin superfamily)
MSHNPNIINVKGGGDGSYAGIKKIVILAVTVFVLLLIALNCFTIVTAGHTGVVVTMGSVSESVLTEGLHVKIPFIQRIVLIDNRVKKAEAECSSASSDLQMVSSVIAINYKVLNSSSWSVFKNIGTDYEVKVINPAIQECVKAVTANFTAEQLITNRQLVSDQMSGLLKDKISSFGFEIQVFNIISFDFTAEYNAAIEAKQTAEQNALKAEQDLKRIRVEAEQTIARAQAEAEAYRLKSQEITPEILLMNYIQKWDGRLPTVMSGGDGMIIDISSLLEQIEQSPPAARTDVTPAPPQTEEFNLNTGDE